jgi:hypothetical protein
MTAAAERAARGWSRGRAANLFDEMVTATFEVISDVTFSGGEGFDRGAVHRAIEQYIGQTAKVSLLDILGAPSWVPRPHRLMTGAAMRQTKAVADRRSRRAAPKAPGCRPIFWTC